MFLTIFYLKTVLYYNNNMNLRRKLHFHIGKSALKGNVVYCKS